MVGVGVDIDQSALTAASGNAARAGLTGVCRWACHDFAQLADERVRHDLASAVSACEESAQSNDHTAPVKSSMDDSVAQSNDHTAPVKEREGIFDVILCNPPYLSAPSVRRRDMASPNYKLALHQLLYFMPYTLYQLYNSFSVRTHIKSYQVIPFNMNTVMIYNNPPSLSTGAR